MGGAAALLSPDVEEERALHVKSVVRRAEHPLRAAGFSVEGRVLHGDPRLALLAFTEDERADLLVLGSHGRTGLAKLLIGSVSSHSVTHAPCSVLVIKDTTQPRLKLQTPSAPRSNAPTD